MNSPRLPRKSTSSISADSSCSIASEEDQLDSSNISSDQSYDSCAVSSDQSPDAVRSLPNKYARKPIRSTSSSHRPTSQSQSKMPGISDQIGSSRASLSPSYKRLYPSLDQSDSDGNKGTSRSRKQIRSRRTDSGKADSPMKSQKPLQMEPDSSKNLHKGSPNSLPSWVIPVGVALGIVSIVVFLCFPQEASKSVVDPQSDLSRFIAGLQELKRQFPAQDALLWHTVSAAIKRNINDMVPIQPAVILFGSSLSARKEADCLAYHVSKLVKRVYKACDPISTDIPMEYASLTPQTAKINLENTLKSGFGGGAKSAVITGLEKLHGDTAMLLHAFCDNDNAPFKKVVILFTMHVNDLQLTQAKKDARNVEEALSAIWQQHINYDDVHALLSRVANNIVIVKKESNDVLQEHCS